MIESSCHCGALKLKIDSEMPETLTSCNCSICSRYGSLMSYFPEEKVTIVEQPENLVKYSWGDKELAFVTCPTCGCFSHWEAFDKEKTKQMGLNSRMFTNVDINKIPVRIFDGAKTWKFLD